MRPLSGESRVKCVHCGQTQRKGDSLGREEIEGGMAGERNTESSKGWSWGLGGRDAETTTARGAHMATLFSTMLGRRYS